jgi:hypothetical protein
MVGKGIRGRGSRRRPRARGAAAGLLPRLSSGAEQLGGLSQFSSRVTSSRPRAPAAAGGSGVLRQRAAAAFPLGRGLRRADGVGAPGGVTGHGHGKEPTAGSGTGRGGAAALGCRPERAGDFWHIRGFRAGASHGPSRRKRCGHGFPAETRKTRLRILWPTAKCHRSHMVWNLKFA